MRKIILFLALLLISCNAQKKVTKTDIDQKQKTETEVSKNTEVREKQTAVDKSTFQNDSTVKKALSEIEFFTEKWEAKLRTYDTSKAVDPKTGTPPLASELVMTKGNTSDKKTTENVTTDVSATSKKNISVDWSKTIDQKIDSAMKANNKLLSNTTSTEKQGWPWWIFVLIGSVITILLYFAIKFKWYNIFPFLIKKLFCF